ncbi:MAG: hypothetical protein WCO60_13915 [Verrucomicrobiota bacterium]
MYTFIESRRDLVIDPYAPSSGCAGGVVFDHELADQGIAPEACVSTWKAKRENRLSGRLDGASHAVRGEPSLFEVGYMLNQSGQLSFIWLTCQKIAKAYNRTDASLPVHLPESLFTEVLRA